MAVGNTLEKMIVALKLKERTTSKGLEARALNAQQNTLFKGQDEGLYEGESTAVNGELPVRITLSYIADGRDVRRLKYAVSSINGNVPPTDWVHLSLPGMAGAWRCCPTKDFSQMNSCKSIHVR